MRFRFVIGVAPKKYLHLIICKFIGKLKPCGLHELNSLYFNRLGDLMVEFVLKRKCFKR